MQIYLVGGAVRDKLLGIEAQDRDYVVVGADPQQMLDAGYQPVGKEFPVFLHPETHAEYALARTERKTAPGYHGFSFHAAPDVTLEQDLQRRDLTINAMAEAPDGTLIDPYGGQADLAEGLLRHVSPAFAEDPVRILRIARYAARYARYGFRVAHGTNALMRRMVADGEVDALVAERVWAETVRALGEPHPERFFEVLRGCGALERIFPELHALFGVPQPKQHHPEIDSGVHTLMVLQQATRLSDDPKVRLAALLHDLGKGTTPSDEWPRHHGHEQRGVELARAFCERLRVPNEFRDLALLVVEFHGLVAKAAELRAATLADLFDRCDAYRRPERFEQFLLAAEADHRGRTGFEARDFAQGRVLRHLRAAANAIQAKAVVADGYSGKAVGEELRQRRIQAIKLARQALDADGSLAACAP